MDHLLQLRREPQETTESASPTLGNNNHRLPEWRDHTLASLIYTQESLRMRTLISSASRGSSNKLPKFYSYPRNCDINHSSRH